MLYLVPGRMLYLIIIIVQIFNTYLCCHLSPPEDIRNIEDKDLEKKLDKKDTDMKKFKEHLDIIGKFYMWQM